MKIIQEITDKDKKEIKYYGNQTATSTDGNIDIELPTMAAGDRLFVFNEQTNGDYKTEKSAEARACLRT